MSRILGLTFLCTLSLFTGCAAFTDSCPAGSDYYSDCRVARREHIREQTGAVMQGLGGMSAQPQTQAAAPLQCVRMSDDVMNCSGGQYAHPVQCTRIGDVMQCQ